MNTSFPGRLGRVAATVPVTDIDRSLGFYRDLLGLAVAFTNGVPTGFVILRRDDAELHLTLVRDHRAGTHNVAHLMVDDATGLYEFLTQHGARVVKRLRDADYGLRGFVVCDPDGNRIDVGQVLTGPPAGGGRAGQGNTVSRPSSANA